MRTFSALSLMLLAAPLQAHPHIFINTGLLFLVDAQNRLTHVQVTWEYDELYSLLVTEDMGVDSDNGADRTADGWQDHHNPYARGRGGARDLRTAEFQAL